MLLTIEFPFYQFTSYMELTFSPIEICLVSSGTSNECNIQVYGVKKLLEGLYWVHSHDPRLLCQVLDHCFNLATLGDDFDTFEWMLEVCIIDFYHLEILQKTLQNSAPLLVKLNETIPS